MMSGDFDYSVKFPTVPFSKPKVVDVQEDSTLLKRNIRRSSNSDSDNDEENLHDSENINEKEPVVLLLGWLGSKEKYLSKYGNIYYQNGCVVIQYTPIADDIFFNKARMTDHAEKLLELLDELTLLENPFFIHLFSNAGAMMYMYILEHLKSNKELQEKVRISGVIWDSAPGHLRLVSAKNAYLSQMPNASGILRNVVGIVFIVVLFFIWIYQSITNLFCRRPSLNFYKQLQMTITPCPHLFLYSKCDSIVSFKDVEEMVALIKKQGHPVTTVSWEDSPHVQHLIQHPESYAKQSIHFIQSCVCH